MINLEDCMVPIGVGVLPPPPPRKKRVPRKCSTCANMGCPHRGTIVDWMNCKGWAEELKEGSGHE